MLLSTNWVFFSQTSKNREKAIFRFHCSGSFQSLVYITCNRAHYKLKFLGLTVEKMSSYL